MKWVISTSIYNGARWRVILLAFVAAIIIVVTCNAVLDARLENTKNELGQVDDDLRRLHHKLLGFARQPRTDGIICELPVDRHPSSFVKNDPHRHANLLQEVASLLPATCWLERLDIDPATRSVTLRGFSATTEHAGPRAAIEETVDRFQHSRCFVDASLTELRMESASTWAFAITAHYDELESFRAPDHSPHGEE